MGLLFFVVGLLSDEIELLIGLVLLALPLGLVFGAHVLTLQDEEEL